MKKSVLYPAILCIFSMSFAFDWPQEESESDAFYSYYGQLRGGTISSSIVFNNPGEIKASEDGRIIIVMTNHGSDFGWFESSLGNTIIITHGDGLSTVYSNLDDATIPDEIQTNTAVSKGTVLGLSGNSAWQESDQSALEFKVFDSKNDTSVNPRVLMPRTETELPLEIGAVTLVDREGTAYDLRLTRRIPSGEYYVYRSRQDIVAPYSTSIAINGTTVETVTYDVLEEHNGRLCVRGNGYYSREDLYPDELLQLAGTALLNRGASTLTVTLSNILNTARTISYRLDVY